MAANRFATLIHRKTNRITLVLVYAFLEWTLIFFLLLNSLLSYFILRFADYFGLKRPCLLCSRLDRFFDPSGESPSHRDLLCHDHALEVSKPLIGSKGCSFESFDESLIEPDLGDFDDNFINKDLIGDDVQVHNGRLFTGRSRSVFVGSVNLIEETEEKAIDDKETEEKVVDDEDKTEEKVVDDEDETEEKVVDDEDKTEEKVIDDDKKEEKVVDEDEEKEKVVDDEDEETEEKVVVDGEETEKVVDVKETEEKVVDNENEDETEEEVDDDEFSCFVSSFDCNKEVVVTEKVEENRVDLAMEDDKPAPETNLEFYIDDQDCHLIPVDEFYKPSEEVREISDVNGDFILDFGAEPDFTVAVAKEEDLMLTSDEKELKPDNDKTNQGALLMFVCPDQQQPSVAGAEEDVRLSSDEVSELPSQGESKQDAPETKQGSSSVDDDELLQTQNDDDETDEEVSIGTEIPNHEHFVDDQSHQFITQEDNDHENDHTLEFRTVDIETRRPVLHANEERFLETSCSMETLHGPHNAMFQQEPTLERPEGLLLSVDKLKSELEEERKALNALYEELEEERSASATAANETMAMINRLHEEKAAMQMEALQYQRMMEEQSEFDQEALQLLNEVIVKREKENVELEKELEVCRKRLEEYEAKERMGMMMMKRMRDSSVDSYRHNGGESDENNGELVHKNVEGSEMEHTPVDVVLRLDECLDDYEGERLSILGRLKFLEEKLTALNDEEEEAKTFESNGNGHLTNGKHRVLKSKRLLPLFDAVDGEMENGDHYENGFADGPEKGEIVTVEEEVDELYERLEALEADREFLRHCVGSLKKGDKGVHLLNEILQHLRDLKNIDLIRVRENEDMSF